MSEVGAFAAIAVCFKFVDFCIKIKDVSNENSVFVRIISRVREDREEAFRLMRKPAVQRHFEADPESKNYVEGTILALNKALQSIGRFVESVRLDEERNGTIGLVNRFEWVLRHEAKLGTRQLELDTCHKSLLQALDIMRAFNRDPLPPAYCTVPTRGDDNYENGDDDFLIAPRRRLQLLKEAQKSGNLIDLDDTTDMTMDMKPSILAMEELRVHDGFTPRSEEHTQGLHTASQFPLTNSTRPSDAMAGPGWEIYEAESKLPDQSSIDCSDSGTIITDLTPPLQAINPIGFEKSVKPGYTNHSPSGSSLANTLRSSRSSCNLGSERLFPQESSSSFRPITPPTLSSPPPSITPILPSSPPALRNDSPVSQSTYKSISPLEAVTSVSPGQKATILTTPAIPAGSTSSTNSFQSSNLLESVIVREKPSAFTRIAPPADTAGHYSARYHPVTYQSREPPSTSERALPLYGSYSTQPFQDSRTNNVPANAQYAVKCSLPEVAVERSLPVVLVECSLPEVVATNPLPSSSQVRVTDSFPEVSIPQKPPKDSSTLAVTSSLPEVLRQPESGKLQGAGDQVSDMEVNTTPYDEQDPISALEDPTREQILKRRARQDLIWGTG